MGTERMHDEPVPGDVLGGRYEILEEIGRGGMATVYKGRDLRLSRRVAVKVFRGGFADAVDPRRTAQEMHLLAGVNHPAIVSVLDASNGDGRFGTYLVMELVVGDDLGALLRRARGPLSADFARRIVADVAGALELLHGQGVVHRDVKPGNILVASDAGRNGLSGITAKLTDFGIAQMVDGAALTAPDSILGTAAYLSPEQVRGARLRPASDVYSLGLVLLEAMTGRRAFPGPAAEAAVARLTRPPALPADASPALAHLLSRMTALDPADRPRAADVAAALREELAGAITAPDAAHTAEVPRVDLVAAAAAPASAAVPVAAGALAVAAAPEDGEDATLPHPNLWTPAAGIPLGTGNVPVQTGPRPVVDPAERRRRFPTLLAVGASALAAAAAGVLVSTMSGVWNAPQAAVGDVRQAAGADAGGSSSQTQSSSATSGGGSAPLRAATGGEAVATTPRSSGTAGGSTSPSAVPTLGASSPASTPSGSASSSPSPTDSATSSAPSSSSTPTTSDSTSPTASDTPSSSDSTTPTDQSSDGSSDGSGSGNGSGSGGGTSDTSGSDAPGATADSVLAEG